MGERRGVYRVLVGNLKERDRLGDPGGNGRIILRYNFRKWYEGVWSGLSWIRIRTGSRHLRLQYESSGSIKCGKFLGYLKRG